MPPGCVKGGREAALTHMRHKAVVAATHGDECREREGARARDRGKTCQSNAVKGGQRGGGGEGSPLLLARGKEEERGSWNVTDL